jgi:membrane-associated protein
MEFLQILIDYGLIVLDYLLHLDRHLAMLVAEYGVWIYVILFAIVFAETGLVVTPFLPGDSLLFAAGALAAISALDLATLLILLSIAAIAGDAVNYAIGRYAGPRVFRGEAAQGFWGKLLNREHLNRAHEFFERYGGKAIVMARFVPIVRTFVPFVAGAGAMTYSKFGFYNVSGGLLWVGVCTLGGYAFGNVPVVQANFSLVIIGIITVSLIPVAIEVIRHQRMRLD